jgi:hypothetical protein
MALQAAPAQHEVRIVPLKRTRERRPSGRRLRHTAHSPTRHRQLHLQRFVAVSRYPKRPTTLLAQLGQCGHAVVEDPGSKSPTNNSDRSAYPAGSDKTALAGRMRPVREEKAASAGALRFLSPVIDMRWPSPARSMMVATRRTIVDGEFELPHETPDHAMGSGSRSGKTGCNRCSNNCRLR